MLIKSFQPLVIQVEKNGLIKELCPSTTTNTLLHNCYDTHTFDLIYVKRDIKQLRGIRTSKKWN